MIFQRWSLLQELLLAEDTSPEEKGRALLPVRTFVRILNNKQVQGLGLSREQIDIIVAYFGFDSARASEGNATPSLQSPAGAPAKAPELVKSPTGDSERRKSGGLTLSLGMLKPQKRSVETRLGIGRERCPPAHLTPVSLVLLQRGALGESSSRPPGPQCEEGPGAVGGVRRVPALGGPQLHGGRGRPQRAGLQVAGGGQDQGEHRRGGRPQGRGTGRPASRLRRLLRVRHPAGPALLPPLHRPHPGLLPAGRVGLHRCQQAAAASPPRIPESAFPETERLRICLSLDA